MLVDTFEINSGIPPDLKLSEVFFQKISQLQQ